MRLPLLGATRNRRSGGPLRRRMQQSWRLGLDGRRRAAALAQDNVRLQARLALLRDATSDGLWDVELGQRKLTDPANEFIWSDQVRRLVGFRDAGELPNGLDSWMKLLHPDDVEQTVAAFTAHILDRSGRTPYDVVYRLRCRNGDYRWFRAISLAQRDDGGRAIRVAGALTDITDRRAILGLKRYAEALIASLPTGLMVLDDGLAVLSLNRAFCDIYGLPDEAAAAGLAFGVLLPQPELRQMAATVLREGGMRHGIGVALGDKRLRLAMSGIQLAEGERRLLVMAEDVTEEQRLREEARAHEVRYRNLALYDTLTGLANRTLFTERLTRALEAARGAAQPLAVLFMDLNRFKEINDTHGHGIGDQVLVRVARRFQAVLREEEILARLAGDEFVVVAEGADERIAAIIAERLAQALVDPVATHGHTFSVGLSTGIAVFPRDGEHSDDLLKRADIAMYRAKAAGGGYRFYRPEMSVGLLDRMEMGKDLGRALAGAGGLELHYQPQVDIVTGHAIGAEALLRWRDPQRGWVSPGQFIPIAESRGMIGALGKWVLCEACRQMRAWTDAGLRFPGRLWINLAARQLEDPQLVATIRAIVGDVGVAPALLALELTESGLMADVEGSIRTMATLRADGFSLAIDDFGTGYSSLAYLKRLPADKLKIDMSFVRDMLTDRHDHTIVTTIIGMARNLGLEVIAEGVEQQAQAQALLALGCGEAQGYYFGRPEPGAVFAGRWLTPAVVPAQAGTQVPQAPT